MKKLEFYQEKAKTRDENHEKNDQVSKGVRWMPRHMELKKDASNGETLRGAVRKQRSADIRMEESGTRNSVSS